MDIEIFHLPDTAFPATTDPAARDVHVVLEQDGVRALAPRLDASGVERTCTTLLAARGALDDMPVARVIAAIDAAARRLRDPGDAVRSDVLRGIAAFSGYSPPMAARVLDRMSEDWLQPALDRLMAMELGGVDAIERFHRRPDGSRARAIAPPLGLHVFSGNVPGVSVTSIVRALLVRSAVFGKSAFGEPVLAPAFARLLSDADPAVGACVAVTWWQGGDEVLEAAALDRVSLVVHYGGEEAIASLRSRAQPGTRFVEHGPRLSFMLVDAGAAHEAATAREAAGAVALFDQQGCVSPQFAWVIGSAHDAHTFARATAEALWNIAGSLPRGRIDAAEANAIRALRSSAEFRAIAGENVELWEGEDLGWTVVFDPEPGFAGSCLNRNLVVRAADSLSQLLDLAAPFGDHLQTVGLGGFRDREEFIAAALGRIGVTRVTPIAAMPWPPVTWHHDGSGPLTELVRWVDLES
jgi:hypothetical protein